MFRKWFRNLCWPVVLAAVLLVTSGAGSAGAFSVDVKNFYFSDYTDSPGPRVINNYNFSSGEVLDNAVVIPAGFVIRPATESTTYRLAPIPDPKKTIAVSLTTGSQKATLQTATEGGVVLDTLPTQMGPTPPYVLPAINQWVMEVSLTNFAGMVDPAKAYRTQIGMGSMVDGPHPEFTATWIGGNLELQAEIYDGGGGSVVWPVPPQVYKEVKTGLTPSSTLLTLRIVCNASGREGKMDFQYRLGGVEANWYGLATYDIPSGSAFMSFPSHFPYIDMREGSSSGSAVTVSGTVRDWNGAVIPTTGVTVSLVNDSSKTTTSSTTDGSFSLAGVPANTPVSLKFSRTGYLDVYTVDFSPSADVNISADQFGGMGPINMPTSSNLGDLGAMPSTGKALIAGRVRDNMYRYSSTVGGVTVTAQGQSKPYAVKYRDPFGQLVDAPSTWGNGRYYVLNVDAEDTVVVTAAKTGWNFNPRTFHTHGDAVNQGQIWGTAPGYNASLSGIVKTFGGTSISGATIALKGDPGKNTTSGGDGSFTFSGLPQDAGFYASVTAPDYVPTYAGPLNFGGAPVTGVTLTLITPAQMVGFGVQAGRGLIGGLAADQSLNALSGATVNMTSKSGTAYAVNYEGGGASTSATGRFLAPNILPGDVVKIDVTKAGYTFPSYYLDSFADAATTKYIIGAGATVGAVSGTVSYSGSKTGNIKIRIESADLMNETEMETTLSAPGAFGFANVPNGRYYLGAFRDSDGNNNYTDGEAYGYYQDAAGLKVITLTGAAVTGISFSLADPAAGATGASAAVTSSLASNLTAYMVFFRQGESLATNSEPIFVKEATLAPGANNFQADRVDKLYDNMPVPAGTYDFYLLTGDLANGPVKGVVQNRQTGVVVVRGAITPLSPTTVNSGATVSARVTSTASGSPLLNTNVRLGTLSNPADPNTFVPVAWGRTDANGDILFEHVPVGSYYLVLMRDGYSFTPIGINVSSNGQTIAVPEANTRMTPLQTPATISGTLTPFGAGVDSRVLLKSGDTVIGQAKPSTTNGGYTINEVLPGTYVLVGSARGQAPQQVNATVSAGQALTQNFTLSSTKSVVVSGLEWLLAHQRADGSFDDNLTGDAHQYVFGWTGYTALTLLAVYENPKYSNLASPDFIGDDLKNQIRDALYGVTGTKNGIKQYFLGAYRTEDDPDTAWSDIGAFYNSTVKWTPSASTPVALEKLIALGLPLNDAKVLGAVQFLLNSQITAAKARDPIYAGGWRYNPYDTDTDNWETAWVVMALMKAGVNPSVPAVIDGVNHIKRSQVTGTNWDAGLFRYQPGQDGAPLGTSAACVLALNFAGESRNSEYVERFFQWAKNNGGFSGVTRYADAYWWSMFPWAAILYADPEHSGKTMYDTLTLTWNMADHIIGLQQQDGRWINNNFNPGGSNSGNSVMYTASALMAIAPYAGLAPRPDETTVSGLVQNPSGGAVQSAKVEALLDGVARASAVTNTSGAYTLNVPQNYAYEIRTTAAGYVRKTITTVNVGTGGLTGQSIAYAAGDVDNVAPTITSMTPPNGQETAIANQLSAMLADDKSGVDPASIVFRLDGVVVAAQYNTATGQATHHPFPWLRPGVHNATIDVKDYAGNSAVQSAWWFRLISRLKGDVNNDAKVDLADVVLSLQVISGKSPAGIRADYAASGADVNGDGRIGLAEVQFSQQRVAGLRTCESGVGVTVSSGADGHPPAWFSFSGGRVDGSDPDFTITNAAGDQPPYSAYGWLNSGYGIIDLGAVGIGGITQVPESGYTIPQSLNLTPGRSYAFRLNDGTYAAIEVKSVTPISPQGVTMVFDYKYQPNGARFF